MINYTGILCEFHALLISLICFVACPFVIQQNISNDIRQVDEKATILRKTVLLKQLFCHDEVGDTTLPAFYLLLNTHSWNNLIFINQL